LYDGSTRWNVRQSAQFSLALGTLTSGKPYDVFCYDNAGVPTLEFLVWTNDTTRATGLVYQDGILVKSGATTRRYLGTFYTTSTTTTEDSLAKRYLWNYYNRVIRQGLTTYSANRSTTSAAYVEVNSEIRAQFLLGVSEDAVFAALNGSVDNTSAARIANAIAFDGTTASAGLETYSPLGAANVDAGIAISGYKTGLSAGFHYATHLGAADAGTAIWYTASALGTSIKTYLQLAING
jgi:hypothetical protein